MKPKLLLFLAILFFVWSCKKSSQPGPRTSTVSISGETYPTIYIGSQEWMAVNYNGPGGKESNLVTKNSNYKKYYIPADLIGLQLPTGWRTPTKEDYNKLLSNFTTTKDMDGNYVGNYEQTLALKSTSDWDIHYDTDKQGTNSSGFNAYPAGIYTDFPQLNATPKNYALFLTSTPLPDAKKAPNRSYYSFVVTQLHLTQSNDERTECFSCLSDIINNSDQPRSVRFVRDR